MKVARLFSILTAVGLALTAIGAQAALKAGDTAPPVEATASLAGRAFHYSLAQGLHQGPVVVYFYPAAFTEGCNVQAHTFALKQEQFAAAGASIVGVSLDSIERLKAFSADPNYCGGKIAVASDADGSIARSFGLSVHTIAAGSKDTRGIAIGHDAAERTTFVVLPSGQIAATVGGLAPEQNVERTLEIVQRLGAAAH